MYAGGADEPIGDQDERPVGERHTLGLPSDETRMDHSASWSNRERTERKGEKEEEKRKKGSKD